MNLNKVELIGNLTADPVVRTLPSGNPIATFNLVTRSNQKSGKAGKRQPEPEFHAIVAWGKLGNVVGKYLKKGDKVYVEGRLKTTQWQGKDKSRKSRTEIVINNLIMLGGNQKKNDKVVVDEVEVEKK